MDRVRQLVELELFDDVPGSTLQSLVRIATQVDVPAQKRLITKDPEGEWVYLVMAGAFRVQTADRESAQLGAGELVGEESLVGDPTHTTSVEALVSSRVLRMERGAFYHLVTTHPEIGQGIIRGLTRRLRHAAHRSGSA